MHALPAPLSPLAVVRGLARAVANIPPDPPTGLAAGDPVCSYLLRAYGAPVSQARLDDRVARVMAAIARAVVPAPPPDDMKRRILARILA